MVEKILIVILSFLVAVLSLSIILRWRKTKGAILLDEKAIKELIAAVVENAKAGKIPDIAERVSVILKNNLKCSRIAFLKLTRSVLETSHISGIEESNLTRIAIELTPELRNYLQSISYVTDISRLSQFLPEKDMLLIKELDFKYFFSVFLRNNLFGIYFINTSLPPSNASLKFLTTALAFSLSAAYHIRQQEKRLKRFENQIKKNSDSAVLGAGSDSIARNEFTRYLKIRSSHELIAELTRALRKECDFDKMVFYARSADGPGSHLLINWQMRENADSELKNKYESILNKLNPGEMAESEKLYQTDDIDSAKPKGTSGNGISHYATIPWTENHKALFGWKEEDSAEITNGKIQDFWRNAVPLIESVGRFERAEEMSYTDGLTGVYNHRYFQKRLAEEFQRAARYGHPLALLILDVDELKVINDSLGHQMGDAVLKSLAEVLTDSIRAIDLISRYGGDEFCLILPETGRNRARLFMNRIRSRIADKYLDIKGLLKEKHYSVSIGGAIYPVDANTVEGLIKAADHALLQAKADGRNCSRLYINSGKLKASGEM